ncbi:MAG: hypothetical protein ACRDUY_09715 [Nitriliruptorales bacterium]
MGGLFGPIGWAVDKIGGFIGDVATAGFELIIGGLVAWVLDAVVWIVQGVFNYFIDAADPNVQADWFITGDGPYATTAAIGASLMVIFLLAGITQGVLSGDVGGMLRRIALDLPVAVLGMVGLVTVTQVLIRLTDELSTWVLSGFQDDMEAFTETVGSIANLGGGVATALVVFLLGLVAVLAGIVLIGELAVRSALVYIVVALAPLVFAAQLWPALKGVSQKLLKLLCALILCKLVIAIALAVAAAAAVGAGSGGEVTSLPEPEVVAEDPGGSVTQAVGILLSAGVAFAVAAFSPLLVVKLLPLAEDAIAAQGIRGMPARAFQQTLSTAYSIQMLRMYRHRGLASGEAGTDGGNGDDTGGGGGGRTLGPGGRNGPGAGGRTAGPKAGGTRSGSGGRTGSASSASGGKAAGGKPATGSKASGAKAAGGKAAGGAGAAKAGAAAGGPVGLAAVAAATAAEETGKKVTGVTKRAASGVQRRAAAGTEAATSDPPASRNAGDRPRPERQPSRRGSDPTPPRPQASSTTPRRRPPRRPKAGPGG